MERVRRGPAAPVGGLLPGGAETGPRLQGGSRPLNRVPLGRGCYSSWVMYSALSTALGIGGGAPTAYMGRMHPRNAMNFVASPTPQE